MMITSSSECKTFWCLKAVDFSTVSRDLNPKQAGSTSCSRAKCKILSHVRVQNFIKEVAYDQYSQWILWIWKKGCLFSCAAKFYKTLWWNERFFLPDDWLQSCLPTPWPRMSFLMWNPNRNRFEKSTKISEVSYHSRLHHVLRTTEITLRRQTGATKRFKFLVYFLGLKMQNKNYLK